MKRWMKAALAILLTATSVLGLFGCKPVEQPQWLKEQLCTEHVYGAGVVERASSCIREGRARKSCQKCGKEEVFSLPKTAHQTYVVPAREATCAQSGYAAHEVCVLCNNAIGNFETTEKLRCAHENDTYLGLGETQCPICGDIRRPVEFAVDDPSDVVFETGYSFRFYMTSPESEAWIVFNTPIKLVGRHDNGIPIKSPTARITLPGETTEKNVSEVKIGYSVSKGGYVAVVMDGVEYITNVDATVSQSADYLEITLSERKYEKTRETVDELALWFELSESRVDRIECSGGGYVVRNRVGRWK